MEDPRLTFAIIGVLTGLAGLIAACTAYVKSKTNTTQGESMEARIKALETAKENSDKEISELKDKTKDMGTIKTKLDNDYRSIETLKSSTKALEQGQAVMVQRVETVEKIAEKVDRLTEIVISVKTLIENKTK